MSRSYQLAFLIAACVGGLLSAQPVAPGNPALWQEYGLLQKQISQQGASTVITYEMKDLTGALAAWEWMRSPAGRPCDLAMFCTHDGARTVISDDNYVVVFEGPVPDQAKLAGQLKALPNRHSTSLPAILTFLPRRGLVPDSARYVLGPVSAQAFAPEFAADKIGFDQGAEAQVAEYHLAGKAAGIARLAVFYYPTPEMARLHTSAFKLLPNTHVKRSGVLVAVVSGDATPEQADTLLGRVQYEAKITWNETPPPSPIKPLYRLFQNIIYLSVVLTALCLAAGLIYACMRLYRRKYGSLEDDEAMTTLHLTRD